MADTPTELDDVIFGDDQADIINGLGGNDVIFGKGGIDWLLGGEGNDVLAGGAGADVLDGGKGRDTAYYASNAVGVSADLYWGTATDSLAGDVDTLTSIENIKGSIHGDTFYGNDKSNTFHGNGGGDLLSGRGGNDEIYGGSGGDYINGGEGADFLDGGSNPPDEPDTLIYQFSKAGVQVNLAQGTAKSGEAEGDVISGFENISGSYFDDKLTGDGGDNRFDGGEGNDILSGGGGADLLVGYHGDDHLSGGDGDDTLSGGFGADVLAGGKGIDTASFAGSSGGVNVNLSTGTVGGANADGDTISGIENLYGSGDADTLTGNSGANTLEGQYGADLLIGGGGNDSLIGDNSDDNLGSTDILKGGGGKDTLTGGHNADKLTGGSGGDTFRFVSTNDSTAAEMDTITDYKAGVDILFFNFDLDTTANGHQTSHAFNGDDPFVAGDPGQIRVYEDGGDTFVELEVSGDIVADFIVKLTGSVALDVEDFVF